MRIQPVLHAFVAACLALSPWPFTLPAAASVADTNGDAVVDVLDFQRAVAEALSGNVTLEADVNGDGVVDVLDVQRILAQATETSEPEPPQQDNVPDPGVVPVPVVVLAVQFAAYDPAEDADTRERGGSLPGQDEKPSPIARLMLGALSPNAPPAAA
ncbi:MAG: hypothetical protein GC168_14380 [Candidatus Hydrogenedens sp.]|nr:hypothetical protein [Candidatus Hydrogenedens sp.]